MSGLAVASGCLGRAPAVEMPNPNHPSWAYQRPIYELNPARFNPAGNDLKYVIDELPRLQALNIGMIHLMPLHPNDSTPYAVTDHMTIDDEYGDPGNGVSGEQRLTQLVHAAHAADIKILMDFVPNHTGRTHPWVTEYPENYERDAAGNPVPPRGWNDVYQLDHGVATVREHLMAAMEKWVKLGVDGFRVDAADKVTDKKKHPGTAYPDFYKEARDRLWALRSDGVFLLAESSGPDLYPEFDASFAWALEGDHVTHSFDNLIKWRVKGHQPDADGDPTTNATLRRYIENELAAYSDLSVNGQTVERFRVNYTHNHDEVLARDQRKSDYGGKAQYEVALMVTLARRGIPYLYNGQEFGNLRVGTKTAPDEYVYAIDDRYHDGWADDEVPVSPWSAHLAPFFSLYRNHPALARGSYENFDNGEPDDILSFGRMYVASNGAVKTVVVVANLGPARHASGTTDVQIPAAYRMDGYRGLYGSEIHDLAGRALWSPSLPPYGYRIIFK